VIEASIRRRIFTKFLVLFGLLTAHLLSRGARSDGL
jgi:hypothetical protein